MTLTSISNNGDNGVLPLPRPKGNTAARVAKAETARVITAQVETAKAETAKVEAAKAETTETTEALGSLLAMPLKLKAFHGQTAYVQWRCLWRPCMA